jgi:hypothetical protein
MCWTINLLYHTMVIYSGDRDSTLELAKMIWIEKSLLFISFFVCHILSNRSHNSQNAFEFVKAYGKKIASRCTILYWTSDWFRPNDLVISRICTVSFCLEAGANPGNYSANGKKQIKLNSFPKLLAADIFMKLLNMKRTVYTGTYFL